MMGVYGITPVCVTLVVSSTRNIGRAVCRARQTLRKGRVVVGPRNCAQYVVRNHSNRSPNRATYWCHAWLPV